MKQYNHTDQRLHWMCQLIAKANRTYVPKVDDYSHTNLYFDSLGSRITGRWIEAENERLNFTLNLSNLHFEVIGHSQQVLASYPTVGKRMDEIESEIENQLPAWGLSKSVFEQKLHLEFSPYDFKEDPIQQLDAHAIDEWKHYRHLANEACSLLLGYAQSWEEIRIWPHHFDTGFYTKVHENLGIGFGLAIEDTMIGGPYFYMSGYPTKGSIRYDNVTSGEGWKWEITEQWKGAVLPLDQLAGKSDSEQQAILRKYLLEAFGWYIAQG